MFIAEIYNMVVSNQSKTGEFFSLQRVQIFLPWNSSMATQFRPPCGPWALRSPSNWKWRRWCRCLWPRFFSPLSCDPWCLEEWTSSANRSYQTRRRHAGVSAPRSRLLGGGGSSYGHRQPELVPLTLLKYASWWILTACDVFYFLICEWKWLWFEDLYTHWILNIIFWCSILCLPPDDWGDREKKGLGKVTSTTT